MNWRSNMLETVKCPHCGYEMTYFDDIRVVCEGCKKVIDINNKEE